MKGKAVIAMSGGVDSSVAARLMKDRGFDCVGITLKLFASGDIEDPAAGEITGGSGLQDRGGCSGSGSRSKYRGCCSLADVNDARDVAFRLGIPYYVLNFSEEFNREVIRRFVETYERGATPNPCIDCNRYIKFERLLLRARQLDFDIIATGHYARIEKTGDRYILKKARDGKKDQSYVLYTMTQDQLAHTEFPLGEMTKEETRELALAQGFVNARKRDSQDICFVPGGDYGEFIERYRGRPCPEGNIIDGGGAVLGRHRGMARYTIGQRRGLGLSFPSPMYVSAKSAAGNTVTLGPEESLYSRTLLAENINLIAAAKLDKPVRVRVKTRYLQAGQWAWAEQTGADTLRVDFDEPQRAVTPGQAAVLYDGDVVVGGGTIVKAMGEIV